MSVSLYTKEEITRSTINNSTSKFMYSFSRAERFPPIKRSGYCDAFYNLPSMTMTRHASIGVGGKSDFTKRSKGSYAEFYSVKRDFDKGNLRGPSFTFGIARDKYAKVYYETDKMLDKNIPGPGKYNYLKGFGSDAKKYSMGCRLNTFSGFGNNKYNNTPGPGSYKPVINISDKGKCPLSKIRNIQVNDFCSSRSTRFSFKSKIIFIQIYFIYFFR